MHTCGVIHARFVHREAFQMCAVLEDLEQRLHGGRPPVRSASCTVQLQGGCRLTCAPPSSSEDSENDRDSSL